MNQPDFAQRQIAASAALLKRFGNIIIEFADRIDPVPVDEPDYFGRQPIIERCEAHQTLGEEKVEFQRLENGNYELHIWVNTQKAHS